MSGRIEWNSSLRDQFTWHWDHLLRERLSGLTDDEYFWEPVAAPFTTIAWRLGHVIVGVLAMRNASHFGREPVDYFTFDYAATADGALAQLDEELARWLAGVEALGEDGLARPCGEAEGPFAEDPMSQLVLHIHRELIHHLSEVCLLRDLYLHSRGDAAGSGGGGGA